MQYNNTQKRATVFDSAARVKHLNEPVIRNFAQGINNPNDNRESRGDSNR